LSSAEAVKSGELPAAVAVLTIILFDTTLDSPLSALSILDEFYGLIVFAWSR
jgi:hypothetical protein